MKTHWLLLVLLGLCGAAHTDRDIVYSARYYTPPGSHRTSHFHIYRINPDGTGRTQLTFGKIDDYGPTWTPDGRHVLFAECIKPLYQTQLYGIDENGGHRHFLRIQKDDAPLPFEPSVSDYRIDDIDSGNINVPDKTVLVNLKTGCRLTLQVTVKDEEGPFGYLLPMPGDHLLYAMEYHNTRVEKRDWLFYQLYPETGTLRRLTDGDALVWSPDGTRFCLIPTPNLIAYERRKHPYKILKGSTAWERSCDVYLIVNSKPLYVRATTGGKMQRLTPILSDVDGADWRKEK